MKKIFPQLYPLTKSHRNEHIKPQAYVAENSASSILDYSNPPEESHHLRSLDPMVEVQLKARGKEKEVLALAPSHLVFSAEAHEIHNQSFCRGLPFAFFLGVEDQGPFEVTACYDLFKASDKKSKLQGSTLYYIHQDSDKLYDIGPLQKQPRNHTRLINILGADLYVDADSSEDEDEVYACKVVLAEMFRLGVVVEKSEKAAVMILSHMEAEEREIGMDLALVRCISFDQDAIAISLLRQGASITATDGIGGHALFDACVSGKEELIRAMLATKISDFDRSQLKTARDLCKDAGHRTLATMISNFISPLNKSK